ncbi:hypothetical protein OQH60_04875 [Campylobacter sp. MIT 21-1685]|uniref:hypothetical protein n=1 Tax=unclassified Campylobacter TaxID=2593542 RepID=UPI00224B45B4|nr:MULTISPECIES: hypothetical protein [unclassified Campylobacter]MCX2683197.1 hypothetical protein [Campylobacter sp. MIT 21-1684]MCX2751483.1 hypothetical protein [Campylobacter sp. MIT 21-1682]MCX2807678.1 hypothetical protein [Campylobacter sp. MIT 21-1685]
MEKRKQLLCIIGILSFDLLALLYGISTLSISSGEAAIYFGEKSLLYFLSHFGTLIFGQNDFGLRSPFLFFHFLSCILLYILALKYTKTVGDSLLSLLLFLLLPGTVASALLVNEASLVIFIALCILCAYEYEKKFLFYGLLILSLFIDKSFNILFLIFFFFAMYKKDFLLLTFSLFLFVAALNIYGFYTGGRPRGYFLDTLGIFAACFSPLVFFYFFYVLYRLAFQKEKTLLWFVMSVTFLFCSLLSLRQKLYLEDFLPFCVLCTPLLIKTLMQSYRVRLPQFRFGYKIFIQGAVIFLLVFYFLLVANTLLYFVLSNPNRHFASKYHFAKELSQELKLRGITEIKTAPNLQKRLEFYGIKEGDAFFLQNLHSTQKQEANATIITLTFGKHKSKYQIVKNETSF